MTSRFGLIDMCLHTYQQINELVGPGLLVLLSQEGELSQVMHIAESMALAVDPVAAPSIMHAQPLQAWSDANGLESFSPPLGMVGVMGELRC